MKAHSEILTRFPSLSGCFCALSRACGCAFDCSLVVDCTYLVVGVSCLVTGGSHLLPMQVQYLQQKTGGEK
jgi:ribonuclease PH